MPDTITTKPFQSQAQWRWAMATQQPFAHRWAHATPGGKIARFRKLPKRAQLKLRQKAWSPAARAAALEKRRQNAAARHHSEPAKTPRGPAKPKQTPEARQAQHDAERQQRRADVLSTMNIAPDGQQALSALRSGEQPDADAVARGGFVAAGLVQQAADGTYHLTSAGRSLLSAADAGDKGRAGDTISAARDRIAKKKPPKEAKPKGGGGGGGGGKGKPDKAQTAAQTAQRVGLRAGEVDALRSAAEGGHVAEAEVDNLAELGLVEATGNNQFEATDAGRRALSALERGDVRGYRAALQDARARMQREQQRRSRRKEWRMTIAVKASSPGDYLVVEDPKQSSTWHLQVRTNGAPDHRLMGAAWAALHGGYRGNVYQGPDKQAAIAKLRALYRSEKMEPPSEKAASSFTVFKDAGGAWRWVSVSSSAYRDRDGEIVSTKALENAVAIADATGFRGPLRWWHCGTPFGPGLDLGDCDFQAVHGRFLIESGTFKSAALALAFKDTDDELSIGFTHGEDAPDRDKVFADVPIVIFERSLAPMGRVSNLFTDFFTTKEIRMDEAKLAALKERVGGDLLAQLLGGVETKDKAAQAAKIAYKADGAPDLDAVIAALKADPQLLAAAQQAIAQKAEMSDTVTEDALPPDGAIDDAEDLADQGADETDENMLTPAECEQIASTVAERVLAELAPMLDLEKKMAAHADALKGAMSTQLGQYTAKKDAEAAETKQTIATLQQQLTDAQSRLKELEGDAPRGVRAGFKASADPSTIVEKGDPRYKEQPKADPLDAFIGGFILNNGAPNPNAPA